METRSRALFFSAVQRELGGSLPFIAEDLGIAHTGCVCTPAPGFHLPGMRVLQFAFDGRPDNPHLPGNYVPNTPAYTVALQPDHPRPGTRICRMHVLCNAWNYLKRPAGNRSEAAPALIELVWSSVAALAMAPLQDLLNLGNEARMNIPGRSEGNWSWRCTEEMLRSSAFEWLRQPNTTARFRTGCLSVHSWEYNPTTECGAARYIPSETAGASAHSAMSCGESRAVSIHRCHWLPPLGGSSNSSGSQ